MQRQIRFPNTSAFDPETLCVAFPAEIDGQRVRCRITVEALQDYFGARGSNDGMLRAFDSYRYRIQEVARSKLEDGHTEVLITTTDFQ